MQPPWRRLAGRTSSRGPTRIATALCLVAAAGLTVVAVRAPAPHRTIAGVGAARAQHVPPPRSFRQITLGHASPPVRLTIPVIALRSRLVGLRLDQSGDLEAPTTYQQAGWFAQGSSPGQRGNPAIIAGHVDSVDGPGVFFRLRQLQRGDDIYVRLADGAGVQFRVYATHAFDKSAFPAREVYGSNGATAELRLITCTGVFDESTGHYASNLVVFARAVAPGSHA